MSDKPQHPVIHPVLMAAFSALSLISTANAQYGHIADNASVSFQQAAYPATAYSPPHLFSAPPEILPYVPPQVAIQPYRPVVQPLRRIPPMPRPQIRNIQPAPRQMTFTSYLSAERQQVIAAAKRQLGIKYRWGGNTPREGFDCSGFTKYSLKALGTRIPRTAAQQSKASRTISRHDLKPGDLIFFRTKGRTVNHVGIYLGNGHFIHAASGGGKVMVDDLRKNYWQKRLHKYGTFLG
ncbi:MAG: hypothetical protein CSA79_04425 [Thiothrix nivea]|nr:MAG: hypothetical protein CSA79_04425 [Thiothrix nivea]